jgi:hypothetical protein
MSEQEVFNKLEVEALLAKQNERFEQRIQDVQSKAGFKVSAVVYNPETKYTYEDDGVSLPPKYDKPIMDHDLWMSIYNPTEEQRKALTAGTVDKDREEDCYTDEYRGLYQEYKSQLNAAIKSKNNALAGAVITSNDFSGLTTNINISRLIGFQLRNNVLEQAISSQAAPNLIAKYRDWVGFEVMPNVAEGVIVEAKKGTMTEKQFTIKKDVGAAAITIEGELTIGAAVEDVFGEHIRWIAIKMRKLRNTKIATALNTATISQAGVDFGPHTGGVSTNDPGDAFLATLDTLGIPGYTLNTIVSHMKPKKEYFANTWIKGQFTANPNVNSAPQVFQGIPGIDSGITWYTDNDITTQTILFAFDREVVVIFEGPKRQVEIQRPDAEVREYYSRDFNSTFIVDQNGMVKMTGVTA